MITKIDDLEKAIDAITKPTMIEVGTEDCQKCRMMKSIISIVDEERDVLKGCVDFMIFDAKGKEDSVAKFGIPKLPFFLFVKGGDIIGSYTGLLSIKMLENKIIEMFNLKTEEGD